MPATIFPLIKKALVDAGYTDIPVISISVGSDIDNDQPAFKVNWMKVVPITFHALFCIVIALLSFIMRLWYVRKKQVHRQSCVINTCNWHLKCTEKET